MMESIKKSVGSRASPYWQAFRTWVREVQADPLRMAKWGPYIAKGAFNFIAVASSAASVIAPIVYLSKGWSSLTDSERVHSQVVSDCA